MERKFRMSRLIHRKEGTEKHFSYLFPASSKTSWFLRGGVGQKSSATAALVEHSTWDSWKRAGKQSKAQARTFPPLLSRACFYGVAPAETGVNLRQADGGGKLGLAFVCLHLNSCNIGASIWATIQAPPTATGEKWTVVSGDSSDLF